MNKNIGAKIKRLRTQKQMTLKDMSEKTNLSIGFLSQLERGLTSVATDSLEKIADVLEVDLTYFFMKPKEHKKTVIRSYEKEVFEITDGKYINYHLSSNLTDKIMFPKLIEILPGTAESDGFNYSGEEFIYVLEGILTLKMAESEVDLYPGDSIHYSYKNKVILKNGEDSKIVNQNHSLLNKTNKVTKIIIVSVPNPYFEEEKINRLYKRDTLKKGYLFLYVENPQLDWGFSKAFSFESLIKKLLLIRYNCGPPTAKNYQKEVVK